MAPSTLCARIKLRPMCFTPSSARPGSSWMYCARDTDVWALPEGRPLTSSADLPDFAATAHSIHVYPSDVTHDTDAPEHAGCCVVSVISKSLRATTTPVVLRKLVDDLHDGVAECAPLVAGVVAYCNRIVVWARCGESEGAAVEAITQWVTKHLPESSTYFARVMPHEAPSTRVSAADLRALGAAWARVRRGMAAPAAALLDEVVLQAADVCSGDAARTPSSVECMRACTDHGLRDTFQPYAAFLADAHVVYRVLRAVANRTQIAWPERRLMELGLHQVLSAAVGRLREQLRNHLTSRSATINLHGLNQAMTNTVLHHCRAIHGQNWTFITGRGKHSSWRGPVLRDLTVDTWALYGGSKATIQAHNPGCVVVDRASACDHWRRPAAIAPAPATSTRWWRPLAIASDA